MKWPKIEHVEPGIVIWGPVVMAGCPLAGGVDGLYMTKDRQTIWIRNDLRGVRYWHTLIHELTHWLIDRLPRRAGKYLHDLHDAFGNPLHAFLWQ